MTQTDYPIMKHPGLFTLMRLVMKGPLGVWMKLVFPLTLIFAGIFFWSIYEFIIATDIRDITKYGIVSLLTGFILAMYKLWFWLEMQKMALFIALKNSDNSPE